MPISELLSAVLDKSGYERMLRTEGSQERLDNLAELRQAVYEYETTCGEEADLTGYLAQAALYTAGDEADRKDRVRLMTVHAAKGLEFPNVFLCELNEGIFPSRKTRTLPSMEEERRLAFVAMTRAEKLLCLSEAEGRNLDGSPRYPSRFLLDVDQDLMEHSGERKESLIREARAAIAAGEKYLPENLTEVLLSPGQRVRHPVFGDGTVVEADTDRSAHLIRFDGLDTARSISFRVKLERL